MGKNTTTFREDLYHALYEDGQNPKESPNSEAFGKVHPAEEEVWFVRVQLQKRSTSLEGGWGGSGRLEGATEEEGGAEYFPSIMTF